MAAHGPTGEPHTSAFGHETLDETPHEAVGQLGFDLARRPVHRDERLIDDHQTGRTAGSWPTPARVITSVIAMHDAACFDLSDPLPS